MGASLEHRFIMQHQRVALSLQQDQSLLHTLRFLPLQRGLALKVLGPVDGKPKTCLERCDFRAKLMAPMLETLFQPAGVECIMAKWRRACDAQCIKQTARVGIRDGQFPTQLSDKAHAGGATWDTRQLC